MDLRVYYQKIREKEAQLPEGDVLVVSLETPDGGKAGVLTEVPKKVAAKMMVEGAVRLATEDEATAFHAAQTAAKREFDDLAAAAKLQISVIPASELRQIRSALDAQK